MGWNFTGKYLKNIFSNFEIQKIRLKVKIHKKWVRPDEIQSGWVQKTFTDSRN